MSAMVGLAADRAADRNVDDSWVVVKVGTHLLAIPTLSVQSMVILPQVVKVPKVARCIRGVINLRGRVLPVVDLRLRCGMDPISKHIEDLCGLLEQREQDHRNWLCELEKSVVERREFRLTSDPHKCAFGKWYDHYRTDDLVLAMMLRRFDEPHKAIHAVAVEVEKFRIATDWNSATAVIERTRSGVLSTLLDLFATTRTHIRDSVREIAVVIEGQGKPFVLAVDNVESTERLDESSINVISGIMSGQCRELIGGVAKRKIDQQMVLLLKLGAFSAETQGVVGQVA